MTDVEGTAAEDREIAARGMRLLDCKKLPDGGSDYSNLEERAVVAVRQSIEDASDREGTLTSFAFTEGDLLCRGLDDGRVKAFEELAHTHDSPKSFLQAYGIRHHCFDVFRRPSGTTCAERAWDAGAAVVCSPGSYSRPCSLFGKAAKSTRFARSRPPKARCATGGANPCEYPLSLETAGVSDPLRVPSLRTPPLRLAEVLCRCMAVAPTRWALALAPGGGCDIVAIGVFCCGTEMASLLRPSYEERFRIAAQGAKTPGRAVRSCDRRLHHLVNAASLFIGPVRVLP